MVSDRLKTSPVFNAAVQSLLSANPPVNEETLCASLLFSRHKLSYFDRWLRDSVRKIVWCQPVLSRLETFVVEHEVQLILEDWLQELSLTQSHIQDTIWTVFMDCLMDRLMRREDLMICLACIIFASAKLLDSERTFAQIITSSNIDEKVFLDIPFFANDSATTNYTGQKRQTWNVLNWYNDYFLPKMRPRLMECRGGGRILPFPSHYSDLTVAFSPFVNVTVSPFRHHLSTGGEQPNQSISFQYTFSPWGSTN
jgi:hypothetical protein